MPNWCRNSLAVSGSKEDVAAFRKAEEPLKANSFLPMPKELEGIVSGGTRIDGEYVTEWREVDGRQVALSPGERADLKRRFGACQWYDWRIMNWGTKWELDVGEPEVEGDRRVRYLFGTAWSPPLPVVEAMSRRYPRLSFRLRYEEPGNAVKGSFWCRGGVPTRMTGNG